MRHVRGASTTCAPRNFGKDFDTYGERLGGEGSSTFAARDLLARGFGTLQDTEGRQMVRADGQVGVASNFSILRARIYDGGGENHAKLGMSSMGHVSAVEYRDTWVD